MRNQRTQPWKLATLALLSAVVIFAINPSSSSGAQKGAHSASPRRQTAVSTLRSIDPLKHAFQRAAGKVRLVTILSPT